MRLLELASVWLGSNLKKLLDERAFLSALGSPRLSRDEGYWQARKFAASQSNTDSKLGIVTMGVIYSFQIYVYG